MKLRMRVTGYMCPFTSSSQLPREMGTVLPPFFQVRNLSFRKINNLEHIASEWQA